MKFREQSCCSHPASVLHLWSTLFALFSASQQGPPFSPYSLKSHFGSCDIERGRSRASIMSSTQRSVHNTPGTQFYSAHNFGKFRGRKHLLESNSFNYSSPIPHSKPLLETDVAIALAPSIRTQVFLLVFLPTRV
ncbi:hypothetical protein K435DRAFT_344345 [Dendrothele bispora CBS 962.96]|uniref:Secreted protein n=1 Tax=Dendrothele bispora (strain CBS 962.96) TaxID=1314807 RepID=A0A4S8MIZ8_DENBC|nr:hypothetical protein K435DRAFT_344345 [Dendrothele bispora CBS 962.96]